MTIPDSISALIYGMQHNWWWTLGVWATTFLGLMTMIGYDEIYSSMVFLSCACLGFVGVMPIG